ncbi:MAG TPA: DUF2156 domain-containing protein [Pyrinomonadaceae bacterium]
MNIPNATLLPDFYKRALEQSSTVARARRIVLEQGWNSTSYQIINLGISRWFSKAGDAVVGFVASNKRRIVAGAPICAKERLPEIAAEFEADAARENEGVCYFCAEARLESMYARSPNYSKILLGAQPVWQPKNWAAVTTKHKSLRAQLNRARNKGVIIKEWSNEKAHDHPALKQCLGEWLATKGLPPLAFLVEPNTLTRLFDRRIFVAELNGEPIGFVVLSPVAQRNGWLFEQFPHRPGAPNGTVELMIDAAMKTLATENFDYATLGLSPLSQRARIESFRNPFWLRVLLAWMRKHGQRFYNFDGLDAFKAKLRPEKWEPVFAVSNEPQISVRTLYGIAAAFSDNAPVKLILGGGIRALKTEMNWLRQRLTNPHS